MAHTAASVDALAARQAAGSHIAMLDIARVNVTSHTAQGCVCYFVCLLQPHKSGDGAVLQERWKYMPHFKGEKLGKLWDLWELQNTHRTFYLGSVTCFESTADVHSYNKQLVDYHQL